MGTGGTKRQQAGRRHLGLWITCNVMTCETTHVAQALCPECRLRMARLLCPVQCHLCGNAFGVVQFHERCKLCEHHSGVAQLKPQASSQREIVVDRLGQWFHCPPPGQGRANVCNDARSTFA